MIKVLNVMEDGRIAGPQLRMLRVAKALNGKIDTIIAIPQEPPFEFRDRLTDAGVPFVQLPLTKLSRQPSEVAKSIIRLPSEILAMKRYIKANNIDVVHSSGGAWMFKAIIAARFAATPSVWHLNDTSSPSVFRFIARVLLKRWVAGVIVAGSRVKSHYLADYEENYKNSTQLTSIDAPVETDTFVPSNTKEEGGALKVITVGNISPVKDYLTVARCAALTEKKISIHWTVVGSSYESQQKYRERLDELVQELGVGCLHFAGAQSNVNEHLAAADVYVCSSAAEASPTSVWEAMSCGLPVVSTDVGCVSDHIQHGENGFVVPPGDFQSMSKYLVLLGESVEVRRNMGDQNRNIAVSNFDISVCASRHAEIYQAVCQP